MGLQALRSAAVTTVPEVRALLFDVFGTVVDWRSAVIRAGEAVAPGAAWPAIADDWRRDGYLVPIARIALGERPFEPVDSLLATKLDELLDRHGIELEPPTRADLARVWHRLDPWPDSVAGLTRLRTRYTIAPLSNGGFDLLTNMAKRAGLPWDCIISAELFHTFKPDPRAYRGGVELLGLEPGQVMLVAAHVYDLRSAAAQGLHTAYVPRPHEWGPGATPPEAPDPAFDVVATDFEDLAAQLGC